MASILDRERTVAGPGFSRWLIPPAALAVHLSIGQAYATSVYKTALVQHFDASLTAIGIIFSIAIVTSRPSTPSAPCRSGCSGRSCSAT